MFFLRFIDTGVNTTICGCMGLFPIEVSTMPGVTQSATLWITAHVTWLLFWSPMCWSIPQAFKIVTNANAIWIAVCPIEPIFQHCMVSMVGTNFHPLTERWHLQLGQRMNNPLFWRSGWWCTSLIQSTKITTISDQHSSVHGLHGGQRNRKHFRTSKILWQLSKNLSLASWSSCGKM